MSIRQLIALIILSVVALYALSGVENFTFGLMDNAPMLALMLAGLDPDGWLGRKLERFNLDPAYIACGVAMLVNTMTDGMAGLCDPNAAVVGVIVGCLVPIAFLPIIWRLRKPLILTPITPAAPVHTGLYAIYNTLCDLSRTDIDLLDFEFQCFVAIEELKSLPRKPRQVRHDGRSTTTKYMPHVSNQIRWIENYLFINRDKRPQWVWKERNDNGTKGQLIPDWENHPNNPRAYTNGLRDQSQASTTDLLIQGFYKGAK